MERIPEDLPASNPVELNNSFQHDLLGKFEKSLSLLGGSWVWENVLHIVPFLIPCWCELALVISVISVKE